MPRTLAEPSAARFEEGILDSAGRDNLDKGAREAGESVGRDREGFAGADRQRCEEPLEQPRDATGARGQEPSSCTGNPAPEQLADPQSPREDPAQLPRHQEGRCTGCRRQEEDQIRSSSGSEIKFPPAIQGKRGLGLANRPSLG